MIIEIQLPFPDRYTQSLAAQAAETKRDHQQDAAATSAVDTKQGDGTKAEEMQVLTRDQQLKLKASSKTRKNGAKNPRKRRKGKGKRKTTVSRRRKILKPKLADQNGPSEECEESPAKRRKEAASSSSTKNPRARSVKKTVTKRVSKAKASVERSAPSKPLAPKEKPSEPEGKPAAKAQAKAASKQKAKAKACPKVKAKAKARGRPRVTAQDQNEAWVEVQKGSPLYKASQVKMLEDFALGFDSNLSVKSDTFKKMAKEHVKEWDQYRLNLYWTRGTVGVHSYHLNKDILHFGFNQSSACEIYRMTVALLCAIVSADGLEKGEPYEKDGELNLQLKHNAYLALFLMANKSETES
eukprot:s89_g43.t1